MHSDAKAMKARGDRLFSEKSVIDTRNQDIAENFYPLRADFTVRRDAGENFMENLMSGYPVMVARELSNTLGTMLRPKGREWFQIKTRYSDEVNHDAKAWLQWATKLQRRAMYDPIAMLTRATKGGDADYAVFGANCISVELNQRDNALLYRCWHLRDMAWDEDSYGQITSRHRNWKPTANELKAEAHRFNFHPKVEEYFSDPKKSQQKVPVRHVCIRSSEFSDKIEQPWMSVFIDCDNEHVMYEAPSWTPIYVTPRWGTMSINPYGVSPATVCALPDARLLQAMTLTMLDANERASNPPLIGVSEAIRGDMGMYPGGFTSVDPDYDERLGEVLRPLTQDKSGLPIGLDILDRTNAMLREAFYLNTLTMPMQPGDQTAYEVGQRVQEYVRQALPIFEPMEAEYNAALCDITFETLMRNGAFGSADEVPEELQGSEIDFQFENPLTDAAEKEKGQKFLEMQGLVAQAAGLDPSAMHVPDMKTALYEALEAIGTPLKWMNSEEAISERMQAEQEMQSQAQALQALQAGADVAETAGRAAQTLAA